MTPEEIQNLVLSYSEESINAYNDNYGTDYTIETAPDNVQEFIALFILISYFGWREQFLNDFNKETIEDMQEAFGENYADYKGINNTTNVELANLEENILLEIKAQKMNQQQATAYAQQQVDEFNNRRNETIKNGAIGAALALTYLLAKTDGKPWVGAITKNDERVRGSHQTNHRRYWLASSYRPWYDFGCRCSYEYFATEQEAENAGYTKKK